MTGIVLAVLVFLGGLGMTALGDMVSEEVRDRLDHLPQAILRLATRGLDPVQRATVYDDEWLPELTYILKGDAARPITRLVHGARFALGILVSTRRIVGLHRDAPPAPAAISQAQPSVWTQVKDVRVIISLPSQDHLSDDMFASHIRAGLQNRWSKGTPGDSPRPLLLSRVDHDNLAE